MKKFHLIPIVLASIVLPSFAGSLSDDMPKWAEGKWTYHDRDYVARRAKIDTMTLAECQQEFKKVLSKDSIINRNRMTFFNWMTLRRRIGKLSYDAARKIPDSENSAFLSRDISNFYHPESMLFTRALFIHAIARDFPFRGYQALGKRLRAKMPFDTEIMMCQLRICQPTAYKADRVAGVELVKTLDQYSNTNTSGYQTVIGYFYWTCWLESRSKEDRTLCENRWSRAIKLSKSETEKQALVRALTMFENPKYAPYKGPK